jgi:predicted nucleic acid-binding protein
MRRWSRCWRPRGGVSWRRGFALAPLLHRLRQSSRDCEHRVSGPARSEDAENAENAVSLVLIDTSVWARQSQPQVNKALAEAVEANAVAMVVPILLELLRSARDHAELLALSGEYEALHLIPLTPDVGERARAVQAVLAKRGYHRGPSPVDLLTAAAAESVGAELWHCDKHFQLIAQVTGQAVRRLGR